MVREILKIRTDNGLGVNNPSFFDIQIDTYEFSEPRMGMPSLKATLMYGECLDDLWTHREYVEFRGERYYIRHTPTSSKSNTDARYKHQIEFQSERAEILSNVYFYDAVYGVSTTKYKPCSNSTKFTFFGPIREFVDRLNCAFRYAGVGDYILTTKTSLTTDDIPVGDGYCAMLDPFGDYDSEKSYEFQFEDKFLWEAISESYEIHEVPFEFHGKTIVFGAVPVTISHVFKYGHDNELLTISKNNANAKIVNRITMIGSTENIPYYYPNETEYGHISIVAEGNKVLTKNMISIKNMNKLLTNIREGSTAILRKADDVEHTAVVNTPSKYEIRINNSAWVQYTLGKEYGYVNTQPKMPWDVRVYFTVQSGGYVRCSNISFLAWVNGLAYNKDESNKISSVEPTSLIKYSDETSESVDLSGQLKKHEDSIDFGKIPAGKYYFQYRAQITTPNRWTLYVKILNVTIESGESEVTEGDYYWDVDDKRFFGAKKLGVSISRTIADDMLGDKFGWVSSDRIPFQTNLMPPKYRNTSGDERFYNADNDTEEDMYIDPDTGEYYDFPNPYIEGAPSEYIYKNEDIKPTIEGISNAAGQLIGQIADVAYDVDDNDFLTTEATEESDKNDALKYQHSFFYLKLHKFDGRFGFDLFASAIQSGEMTIQMTSGSCNGCKFKIQAIKKTDESGWFYFENPVRVKSPGGDIVDGSYSDKVKDKDVQEWQQNTQDSSIWICVQKDASTFGHIIPNNARGYKPAIGDTFNIINIELPKSYITYAELRLEEEGMRYMSDNNEEKFTFDMTASRIFFAEHPDILSLLSPYIKVKIEYNDKIYPLYVNELTVKCKSNEVLPDIQMSLVDTISVGQGFMQRINERIQSLIANAYTLGYAGTSGGGGMSAALAERRYLNKMRADRTPYRLSTDTGFEVGEYVSGVSGGFFMRDSATGLSMLEVDKLYVRMKAIFEELEIVKVNSIGGKQIITPGGAIVVSYVEDIGTHYRCFFKNKEDDKGVECRFQEGDLAYSQEFNIKAGYSSGAENRFYWRLVIAVNNEEGYICLSKADCADNSDAPQIGDTICQLGNKSAQGIDRRSAIIMSTTDTFAPCITLLDGINDYSLEGKSVVEYGVDKSKETPEPFFNCFGRAYIGPRSRKSYLEVSPADEQITFKGKIVADSTIGDKTLAEHIANIDVGSRNLLADSKSLTINGETGAINPNATNYLVITQPIEKDKWYAFKVDAVYNYMGNAQTFGNFTIEIYDDDKTTKVIRKSVSLVSKYVVFQAEESIPKGGQLICYAGNSSLGTYIQLPVYFNRLSLVAGKTPLAYWQAAPEDVEKSINKYDYLTEAMRDSTTIDGGLMLTSVVSCGQYNQSTDTQQTMSGLNGIYKTGAIGGGIALWTGGDMYDLANFYTWDNVSGKWVMDADKIQQSGITDWSYVKNVIAKGVDRMDGSGYRANGNLWWDNQGNTTFVGNIRAKGSFEGIRRRTIFIVDNSNYHDFLIGTMDRLEVMSSVMYFKRALRSYLDVPDASVEYLGEKIVIAVDPNMVSTEGYTSIFLRGNFYSSTAGAATPITSLELKRGYMAVLTCECGSAVRWIYHTCASFPLDE